MEATFDATKAQAARDRFEALILTLRDDKVSRQCVGALMELMQHGGIVTERDYRRLYGHLEPGQWALAFMAEGFAGGLMGEILTESKDGT